MLRAARGGDNEANRDPAGLAASHCRGGRFPEWTPDSSPPDRPDSSPCVSATTRVHMTLTSSCCPSAQPRREMIQELGFERASSSVVQGTRLRHALAPGTFVVQVVYVVAALPSSISGAVDRQEHSPPARIPSVVYVVPGQPCRAFSGPAHTTPPRRQTGRRFAPYLASSRVAAARPDALQETPPIPLPRPRSQDLATPSARGRRAQHRDRPTQRERFEERVTTETT